MTSNVRKPRINPPATATIREGEYVRECTLALRPSIESLMDMAAAAGWDRQQAAIAIVIAATGLIDEAELQAQVERLDLPERGGLH